MSFRVEIGMVFRVPQGLQSSGPWHFEYLGNGNFKNLEINKIISYDPDHSLWESYYVPNYKKTKEIKDEISTLLS